MLRLLAKPLVLFVLALYFVSANTDDLGCASWRIGRPGPSDYGVGFSLSLLTLGERIGIVSQLLHTKTYSTAGIYLTNGTLVDVAKIEGGPRHKHKMRQLRPSTDYTQDSETDNPTVSRYRDLVKHWPHLAQIYHPAYSLLYSGRTGSSLEPMIASLRKATESYLETRIDVVDIALPFRASPEIRGKINHVLTSMLLSSTRGYSVALDMAVDLQSRCSIDANVPDRAP